MSTDFLVRDVLDKLADVGFSAANWRELGERLIPKADFPSIEEDHQTCDKRLRAVIDEWQRKGSNPCWETLATAVAECKKYGGQNVAQKLLKSVGIEPLGESGSTEPRRPPSVDQDDDEGGGGAVRPIRRIPHQSSSIDSAIGSEALFSPSTKQFPLLRSFSISKRESISEEPLVVTASDVYNEISEAKNQAFLLGVKLHLPKEVTKDIVSKNLEKEERLLKTIEEYLKLKDNKPDWKEIALALKQIQLTNLAERVENNHLSIQIPTMAGVSTVSVEREYRNLKTSFRDFVCATRDGVMDKRISIQMVVDVIVDVGGGRNKHYFMTYADDLRESRSIEAVFDRIRQHWDSLHPEIYGHLIRELSLAGLEQIRDDYQTALDNFLNLTLLSDFCDIEEIARESEGDPPKQFTRCITKHKWEPPPKFLRDVENLRKQFAHCCNLQSCAVTVCGIRRGCTSITFLVPESIDLAIANDPQFIRDHCIIHILFKGNLVYSEDNSEIGTSVDAFLKLESSFPAVVVRFVWQELSRITSVVLRQPQTPLTSAAADENLTKVQELLAKGADPNPLTDSTPLKETSYSGDVKMAMALIQAGANPDLVTDDWTALMEACRVGRSEIIELLLDFGHGDPNTVNSEGWTALMTASRRGHYQAVDILLQRGANPDMQDYTGWSALMAAVYQKNNKIAMRLIDGGATPDIEDKNHTNALLLAIARHGQEEVVDAMLDHNPNVNLQDSYGETALIFACKVKNLHFVRRLLRMGANPNIYNNDKETPVLIAIGLDEEEILLELLDSGADPNMGVEPPLVVAAHIGNPNIVRILKKFEADTDLRDRHGVAAFEVAEIRNFQELIRELDPHQMSSSTPKNVVKLARKSLTSVVNQLKRGPQFLITETQRESKSSLLWAVEKIRDVIH